MTAILRAALLAALLAALTPAIADEQRESSDSLSQRIVLLERKSAELEQRVRELEALIKAKPSGVSPAPASGNWRELANWRRLRRGMTEDQVRALLGEPDKVHATVRYTVWNFGKPPLEGEVGFNQDGLAGWTEPTE